MPGTGRNDVKVGRCQIKNCRAAWPSSPARPQHRPRHGAGACRRRRRGRRQRAQQPRRGAKPSSRRSRARAAGRWSASPTSSTRTAVHAMADAALKKFGRIDYLINNAALRGEKAIEHMTFEEWRHITGVVLDGAFHCVKACLGAIKKSDAGSIINVGGLTGAMGAPDRAHVVTAKAGIAGFTRGARDGACAATRSPSTRWSRRCWPSPTSRTRFRRIRSTGRCWAAPPGRPISRRWRASWSAPARAT